jgi:hypothetical protein
LKKKWDHEKRHQVYADLITQITDELRDEYLDVMLACLEVTQNRFNYAVSRYPAISSENLYIVLRVSWVPVDSLMNGVCGEVHEPQTYRRYLFVNRTEYGVKNINHLRNFIH